MRIDEYNERREEIIATKSGAVWNTFVELDSLLNKSQIANQYFGKSQSWLAQRINGCTVKDKTAAFTEQEYHQLAESLRDIARRLQAHADEIDRANPD